METSELKPQVKKFTKEFRVYRANNKKTGAASKFQLSCRDNKVMLFVEMAKQLPQDDKDGNAQFDWKGESKVVMKLEETDIGELLCVFRGLKREAGSGKGLFHKHALGNSILTLTVLEKENYPPQYGLKISSQKGDVTAYVQHGVSLAEGEIIRILLEEVIKRKYEWGNLV